MQQVPTLDPRLSDAQTGDRPWGSLPATDLPAAPQLRMRQQRLAPWRGLRTLIIYSGMLLAVAQLGLLQGYRVYGNCMEPNVHSGERLLGNRLALLTGVQRGDLVVFRPPHQADQTFIKRIVALPGERVEIRHSRVYVNGKALNEPYLVRTWHDDRAPFTVAPGNVFVMGDNRDHSNDSREWGELPIRNIISKATFRYWPPEKIGPLR